MFSAISAIATLTCSGIAGVVAFTATFWLVFFTVVVPLLLVFLAERPTPTTRRSQAGDRHLNFYETRDNLSSSCHRTLSRGEGKERSVIASRGLQLLRLVCVASARGNGRRMRVLRCASGRL
jgi:hypothetical protein